MRPTLSNAGRPYPPRHWTRTKGPPEMDWHHVIPFAVLRRVWNLLVDAYCDTQLQEAHVALFQYIQLCANHPAGIEALMQRLRRGVLEVHEGESLGTIAAWPPWNVVEGPKNRSDNPGDGLDRYREGLTPLEIARWGTIERIYERFVVFGSVEKPSPPALDALAGAMRLARMTLACDFPVPFRASMWVKEADGRWRKRRADDED